MINPIDSTVPVTYTTKRTIVEVISGKETGEKKYTETSFDTVVYDQNGQTIPVTRVNKVDYYA
jgi:hypothetical protein